jgi:proteasome-associated ATPase
VRDDEAKQPLSEQEAELAELREQAATLERLQDAPKRVRTLEERLLETKGQLAQAVAQNEKLTYTLREARDHIAALRDEVDKLTQPPAAYGTVLGATTTAPSTSWLGGRKMRVEVSPSSRRRRSGAATRSCSTSPSTWSWSRARPHRRGRHGQGGPGTAAGRSSSGGPTRSACASWADALAGACAAGDTVLMDTRSGLLLEKLPRPEVEELVLEEVPDISYADIGGLDDQIEQITDAVELPFLHSRPVRRVQAAGAEGHPAVRPARLRQDAHRQGGRQLAGQEGRRGDRREQARSYFINIKGPELLNKYVGETERQIRLVFQRAREKAEEGWPVIVFFDEMDSLFRTRGSGISSDMESTIVPQLLAEIDGVETLRNVIVIGASNREDLIDPAILRPGRLDVKIKIDRPDAEAAAQIFARTSPPTCRSTRRGRDLGGGDPDKACGR